MPPPGKARSGWHLPGYNFCGPFTDITQEDEPVDEIDSCCRQHDLDYSNADISTEQADRDLVRCLPTGPISTGIKTVFAVKSAIDKATNYGSDNWFRAGIAQKRKQQQYYRNKAKQARLEAERTCSRNREYKRKQPVCSDEPEEGDTPITMSTENGDVDIGEPPAKRTKRSAEGGQGSGGGGVGGSPDNCGEIDRPFGQSARRLTRYYKKSFISYITNGLSSNNTNFGWTQQNPSGDQRGMRIDWNEGWQIIPWGIYKACLSRHEFNMLNMQSRRWRPIKFDVEIEGIIPFQNVLQSSGTKECVASFSNRPNLHIYVDDGHILPQQRHWGLNTINHNEYWSATVLNYSGSKLKSPKFALYNINTGAWKNKDDALPSADKPQKLFSLYNTGKVKSMYPGQKFKREYQIMNAQWRGARGQTDFLCYAEPYGQTAKLSTVNIQPAGSTAEPMGGEMKMYTVEDPTSTTTPKARNTIVAEQVLTTDTEESEQYPRGAHYADTNRSLPTYAPPYILARMEPYYQPDDTPMDIFAQVHIHYGMEIELEELDAYGSNYDPTAYESLSRGTDNIAAADSYLAEACAAGPNDNMIGRIFTENESAFAWA